MNKERLQEAAASLDKANSEVRKLRADCIAKGITFPILDLEEKKIPDDIPRLADPLRDPKLDWMRNERSRFRPEE